MKIIHLIAVSFVSLALILGVTSCNSNRGITSKSAIVGGAQASWAKWYTNLSDLVTDSDYIAVGVIDKIVATTQENEHLYTTSFKFSVETVLKGKADDGVTIYQTGTADKPWTIIVDDPLFQVGDRYLLFLDNSASDIFVSMGGPCGRYKVLNSKVYSMNHILQNNEYTASEALDFNGKELAALSNTITEILDTVRFISPSFTKLLAGEMGKIEVVLTSGKYEENKVSYKISRLDNVVDGKQIAMPKGMEINIEPSDFVALPRTDYKSIITIKTDEQIITPGDYWILVEYEIGTTSGQQIITVNIDTKKLSEIKTRPQ